MLDILHIEFPHDLNDTVQYITIIVFIFREKMQYLWF